MADNQSISETWHLFDHSHVPYRILLLAKMLDRVTARQIRAEAGLSLAEWRVLAHAAVLGEATANRIATAAGIDRAEASRAVTALLEKRLIGRTPDAANRKRLLIALTEDGLRLHAKVRDKRTAFFAEVTADLAPEELAELDAMLLKIARRTEQLQLD